MLQQASFKNQQLPLSGIGIPRIAQWLQEYLGGTETASGIKVDSDNAISLSAVFNAMTLLSESVAQLPVCPYIKETVDGRVNRRKLIEHPSYKLVHGQPNEWMSSQTFKKTLQSHLCRYDRAYALIDRNSAGQPTELFPLHPKWVKAKIKPNRRLVYEVTDFYGSGETVIVQAASMFHLIGYTDNGLEGRSRVNILAESLGNAQAAERFSGEFYGKGIHVSGFIKTPNMVKDEQQADRIKSSFVQKYGGNNSKFGVGLLEGGSDWISNEIDPEKSQLNETRKVNGQMVSQIFNIPLPLLKYMDSVGGYNSNEQLDLQYVKYSLTPWLVNWEEEYQRKLLTESEIEEGNIYFKHNLSALLRGDSNARGMFYERMQRTGAYSPNDILESEDKNGYEGGDVHVINPGAQTIEQLQNDIQE